jgi:hypothetical protein
MEQPQKVKQKSTKMMRGYIGLYEVLDNIKQQLQTEHPTIPFSFADAQKELVERVRVTGIDKRKPKKGEILLY